MPMSLDEFKAWLKTKSDAEPAGAPVSVASSDEPGASYTVVGRTAADVET